MTTRRITVGVPMLARPRREVVELNLHRERALRSAVVYAIDLGLVVVLWTFLGVAGLRWWGF